MKQFPSYEGRTYYFRGTLADAFVPSSKGVQLNRCEFVLKIYSAAYPCELLNGLNCIMNHLRGKGIQCPYPLTSRDGSQLEICSESRLSKRERSDEEREYCAHVLFFIHGDLFDKIDRVHITPRLVYETGKYIGSLDAALQVGCLYSNTWVIISCAPSVQAGYRKQIRVTYHQRGQNHDGHLHD